MDEYENTTEMLLDEDFDDLLDEGYTSPPFEEQDYV